MQFHLNGFEPGDPDISDPTQRYPASVSSGTVPKEVDILIVGCGPAGLTLAAQLSAFPDIKTCIVEQKPGPLLRGQADGVACRTMEMFQAYGFSERVLKEACWINETTFWKPDGKQRDHIVRSGRVQDTEDGLSEFPHVVLNQARVHDFFLDVMRKSPTRLEPHYARRLLDLQIEADATSSNNAYPFQVTARLERLDPVHEGEIETIKARHVVGCDGARSTVRKNIGRTLRGDSANHAWGVMDVLAVTDFPDIRFKSLIQSANDGSIIVIPREGGYLVRLYVEMDKLAAGERISDRNITADDLITATRRIMQPYSLDVKEVAWWSVYEIGQRLCDKFDDVPEGEVAKRLPCVFIAGDACHTHSPKAGAGHERVHAGRLQSRMEAGVRPTEAVRTSPPAYLLSGTPGHRQGADRVRSRMGRVARIKQRVRPGGDAELFRQARALHGGNRGPLQSVDPHRRGDLSASGRGACDWHALSFRAGHSSGGRKAGSSRTCGQGGWPLAHLRLCRSGGSRRAQLGHPSSVRLPCRGTRLSRADIHPDGRGHRLGVRCPCGFPAKPSRAFCRDLAVLPSTPEGTLRTLRLRKNVLPATTSSACVALIANRVAWWSRGRTNMSRTFFRSMAMSS